MFILLMCPNKNTDFLVYWEVKQDLKKKKKKKKKQHKISKLKTFSENCTSL